MNDEGIIKFKIDWTEKPLPPALDLEKLIEWRNRCFDMDLIGCSSDGISFGNISIREPGKKEFIISGTQTGSVSKAERKHFCQVNDWDIDRNFIQCEGALKASSESLTHAMIYETGPSVHAVIHGHCRQLWQKYKDKIPTTSSQAPYGTCEMALEVRRLFETEGLGEKKIFVTGGHEAGIVVFGKDLEEAGKILKSLMAEIS